MANVLKHRFASGKANGPDATQVQPSHWNDGHIFSGGNAGDLLTRDPTDASYGAKWVPANQLTAPWTDVPYAASDYTGSGSMIWTVEAGDVITSAVLPIGRMLLFTLQIDSSSVGGSPATYLRVKVPFGYVPARSMDIVGSANDGDLGTTLTRVRVFQSDPNILILRTDGANWRIFSNATSVRLQMSILI